MAAYNLNPAPQYGAGAFGAVPGPIGMPNPAGSLGAQIPNLGALNTAASGDILSQLGGTLSAGTQNALHNAAATMGVTSGMPGSGLSWNSLYGNIAGASEMQQKQGLSEYNSFIPTVSGTQTVSPNLQTEIAGTNASNAAAPNPQASASYAQQLFDQYLQQLRGPAGGTGAFGSPASGSFGGSGADSYSMTSFPSGAFSSLGNPSSYGPS